MGTAGGGISRHCPGRHPAARADREVAVAVTGLSAFSAGIEIFLTARIRPSAGHPEEHLPGGPRDLAASRRSSGSACSSPTAARPPGAPAAAGRTTIPSQRGRSCTRSRAAADRTLSSPGGGRGRCRPPGRWSSSASGRRSASPNPGSASMRSSSSTRHGAVSGYGRKTRADGESLPGVRRAPALDMQPARACPRAAVLLSRSRDAAMSLRHTR